MAFKCSGFDNTVEQLKKIFFERKYLSSMKMHSSQPRKQDSNLIALIRYLCISCNVYNINTFLQKKIYV